MIASPVHLLTADFSPAAVRACVAEFKWLVANSRAKKVRTMREFAEAEIVIPNGRFAGQRFRTKTQPFTRLWLEQVDSGEWVIVNTCGPSQTGKTLLACAIPCAYHLFEIGEDVIFGLPDQDMADDKWQKDLKPVIEASFPHLMPVRGEGSKGGKVKNSITFANGATLKFMTGGAGGVSSDKGRAGYTARVLIVTEKSAFGTRGEASDEANKLEQLRARTRHYGDLARIYEESTLTTELDPTWQDHKVHGTESRIAAPCVHCGNFVSPEREHLAGWQEAIDILTAKDNAWFFCPACGEKISEPEREVMNAAAVLLHRGQSIDKAGTIAGERPRTDILGFRWSAFQNNFLPASKIAADEWRARHSADEDDAERKLCQFVWAVPYASQLEDVVVLSRQALAARQAATPRGLVPQGTQFFTIGRDVHKKTIYWVAIAWMPDGSSVVVDYGIHYTLAEELGEERGVGQALDELDDVAERGWTWEGHPHPRQPDCVFEDSGWRDDLVAAHIHRTQKDPEKRGRYYPTKGFGDGQLAGHSYTEPTKTGGEVRQIGLAYHVSWFAAKRILLVKFDADFWKIFSQTRLSQKLDEPGAMRLFSAAPKDHQTFVRQACSERQYIEFVPDRGQVLKWKKSGKNHYGDAISNGCLAGHFVGVRVVEVKSQPAAAAPAALPPPAITTPSGQPFFILER